MVGKLCLLRRLPPASQAKAGPRIILLRDLHLEGHQVWPVCVHGLWNVWRHDPEATYCHADEGIGKIPKQIFMFWESGWEGRTRGAALAVKSFQLLNPTWKIHLLNGTEADNISQRQQYISDEVYYGQWKVQARSDVLRTILMYQLGGVWADASLVCNRPLDSWLMREAPDLITFQRHYLTDEAKKLQIHPWITSWFLASPPRSKTMFDMIKVVTDPNEQHRMRKEYFWWHRIASEVFNAAGNTSREFEFVSADAMHCKTSDWTHSAPVLKRCANKKIAPVVAISDVCCNGGGDALLKQKLEFACRSWNCLFLSKNLDHMPSVRKQFDGNLPDLNAFTFANGAVQIAWPV